MSHGAEPKCVCHPKCVHHIAIPNTSLIYAKIVLHTFEGVGGGGGGQQILMWENALYFTNGALHALTMNSFTTMNSSPTVNSMMQVFLEALISLSIKC